MSDYLQWHSKLSLEQVFAAGESISFPTPFAEGVIYLSPLKQQNGRMVLHYQDDTQVRCVTPSPFSLRTKINEYGGKPYWLHNEDVLFVNQADQRLYRQSLNDASEGTPYPVSPAPAQGQNMMFAEVTPINHKWLLAVLETTPGGEQQHRHSIAAINASLPASPIIELASSADFYSNLVVDIERSRVAWVQWNHPSMPWDETELWSADLVVGDQNISLEDSHRIDLEQSASVCQLSFANNGRLFFSADFQNRKVNSTRNYWNILSYDWLDKACQPVTDLALEFGYPHWQYGDARIVQFDCDSLLAIASEPHGDQVFKIDQNSLQVTSVALPNTVTAVQNMVSNGVGRATMVALHDNANPSLLEFGRSESTLGQELTVKTWLHGDVMLDQPNISQPEHIAYPTRDRAVAYGYYYPPKNAEYYVDQPPPLIVMVHGGPTGRAAGYFDIQKQFWTNRGFALFDVNHRGSCGYGRAYRDALYGQWGELDCHDIIDGIEYLIKHNRADRRKICIRGKSAGGYAVLRALTEYPGVFKAGACYYGIGNLATLAETTHKFEKYYTDRLIGEDYTPECAKSLDSQYYQRSPINKVDQINSAMIVLQGLQDNIVPPAVAREMVAALKSAGVEHCYVEYPDEGHGFRQVQNNIDAWSRELDFYRKVLNQ